MKFSQKVQAQQQAYLTAGEKTGFQKACDYIAIALNSPECMGKGVMSGEKIERVMEFAAALDNDYWKAYNPRDPEADYYQERLDDKQRKIFKDKAQPFPERYPYIKAVRYEK